MNISFILNNLGNSELAFDLISTVNRHPENSNALFYQNILPPVIEPQCVATNLTSLSSITGTAVVFDLDCAEILEKAGTQTRNVCYLYDLEWFFKPVNYLVARNLLDKFEVYARNEKYACSLSNYLNKDVKTVASVERLYECLTTN